MGFSFANLTRWLFFAGVALAVAYAAGAQPAGRRMGQPILFSSVDGDGVSSNMPSLAPKPPGMLDLANAVQAPDAGSGASSQTEALPAPPPPTITPAQVQQMQRLIDERNNWALRTPDQILDSPMQKKNLGIQDRDALGNPKNETVVAQYFKRQEQSRARTNTDNYGANDSMPRLGGATDGLGLPMNANIWAPAGGKSANPASMDQLLNGAQGMVDSQAASARAQKSGWTKSFKMPETPPGPSAEQRAAMAQFQQLLQPRSPSVSAGKSPELGSPIFSPSSTAQSSPAPAAIPMGASYAPLSGGIGMPTGVDPLPGLLGPTNAPLSALVPDWKPQTPPWASSAPQLGVVPQRKF